MSLNGLVETASSLCLLQLVARVTTARRWSLQPLHPAAATASACCTCLSKAAVCSFRSCIQGSVDHFGILHAQQAES